MCLSVTTPVNYLCILVFALNKAPFQSFVFYFTTKTYVCDQHCQRFCDALLMRTRSVCFLDEIRKQSSGLLLDKYAEKEETLVFFRKLRHIYAHTCMMYKRLVVKRMQIIEIRFKIRLTQLYVLAIYYMELGDEVRSN